MKPQYKALIVFAFIMICGVLCLNVEKSIPYVFLVILATIISGVYYFGASGQLDDEDDEYER